MLLWGLLLLLLALASPVAAAAAAAETCAAEGACADLAHTELLNFAGFEAFSLAHWQRTFVLCGFFDESTRASGVEMLHSLRAQLVPSEADEVRLAWTGANDRKNEGGDLSNLFPDDTRCHIFPPRTVAELSAPAHQVAGDVGAAAFLEELAAKVRVTAAAPPAEPYFPSGGDAGTEQRYLLDYGALDRAAIEAAYPSVREPMCGGAPSCEVERRSELSPTDFLNEYYLWGRPVIVTDAMEAWPLMKKWDEAWLKSTAPSLVAPRDHSGESQILSALDPAEQAILRRDYSVPYFLADLPRGGGTEAFEAATADAADSATNPEPNSIKLDTELFFFGEKGASGFGMHLDTGCHQYWVPHIKGTKKWTLKPIVPRNTAIREGRDPAFQYPELTATIGPGEILVFFSGWTHMTEYIEPNKTTLSFTMYLHDPMPKFYLDEYRHDLLTRAEYGMCMDSWFDPQMIVPKKRERI